MAAALKTADSPADPEIGVTASMLIFDLEAVDNVKDTRPCVRSYELFRTLQVLAEPQTSFEARLLQDVRSYKKRLISEEGHVDIVVLATHLAAIGYRVAVRTALGGGTGQECFHNLHYEFLLVTDEHSILELIVDPRFRDQFLISQSTEGYTAVLDSTPEEFVGSAARLMPMVKLLCGRMQESFASTGLTCPPWRRADSMISKWMPSKVRDVEVASPSSSPDAQYGKSLPGMSPRSPLSRCNSGATSSSTLSSKTCLSRQSSMPSFSAKPIVRQAGFRPSFSHSIAEQGPESTANSQAAEATQRSKSLGLPKSSVCKEVRTLSGMLSDAMSPGRASANTAPQDAELGWQTPRIRTVKMAGGRA